MIMIAVSLGLVLLLMLGVSYMIGFLIAKEPWFGLIAAVQFAGFVFLLRFWLTL